jgi:hypothetical protein
MIIHVLDKNKDVVFCNASPECISCMVALDSFGKVICPLCGQFSRVVGQKSGDLFVYYCNKNHIDSSRLFKTELQILLRLLENIGEYRWKIDVEVKKKYRRLLHNLITYNAHISQDLYNIIPFEVFKQKGVDSVRIISKELSLFKKEHAVAVLRILKNSTMMKSEFSVFEKLYNESPSMEMVEHEVHKVILAVFNSFWYELIQNGVKIDIKKSNEKFVIDYDSVSAALAHLIDNTVKYIAQDTDLTVYIYREERGVVLDFEMISMYIYPDEIEKIFEEGYSGRVPKNIGTNGSGIGLYMIKKLLSLNGADIEIIVDHKGLISINNILYSKNIVKIVFNKK